MHVLTLFDLNLPVTQLIKYPGRPDSTFTIRYGNLSSVSQDILEHGKFPFPGYFRFDVLTMEAGPGRYGIGSEERAARVKARQG